MRVKDVERENKRMAETVKDVNQQLSKLDYEHRTLQKTHSRLEEQVEKVQQVGLSVWSTTGLLLVVSLFYLWDRLKDGRFRKLLKLSDIKIIMSFV